MVRIVRRRHSGLEDHIVAGALLLGVQPPHREMGERIEPQRCASHSRKKAHEAIMPPDVRHLVQKYGVPPIGGPAFGPGGEKNYPETPKPPLTREGCFVT